MKQEPIGIAMVLKHFTNKYLNTVPVLAEPQSNHEAKTHREQGGEARESTTPQETRPTGKQDSRGGVQPLPHTVKYGGIVTEEVLTELTRYGEAGEPLTLKVLGIGQCDKERGWYALPEAEVVESNGGYQFGEYIPLDLEEVDQVLQLAVKQYEAPYSREEE